MFEEEKSRLLPLPAHAFSCDLVRTVSAEKTAYVRFDLNDYSLPPQSLGRDLTLVASPTTFRLLDGSTEIASHPRSYDHHDVVADPAHHQAVLEQKRKALGSTPSGRLAALVPESQAFRLPSSVANRPLILPFNSFACSCAAAGFLKSDGQFTGAIVIAHPAPLFRGLYLGAPPSPIRQPRRRLRCPSIFQRCVVAEGPPSSLQNPWPTSNGRGPKNRSPLDRTRPDPGLPHHRSQSDFVRHKIDEIGYIAYDAHAADLLFEIVNHRYERNSILVTTNKRGSSIRKYE